MKFVKCLLALLLLVAVGCGTGGSSGVGQADYGNSQTASAMFNAYMGANKGKTPPNEEAFRAFLETKQEVLLKTGRTIDGILTSPRSGQPLEFVYGKKPVSGPNGMLYFAYEKEPIEGKRLVIAGRGIYELMDESHFKQIFP